MSNTGEVDGAEVVQVYVGKPNSKVDRAKKELKGFAKVALKQGEKKTVTIAIDISKLKYYDTGISDWNLELGNYDIYVGNASDNIIKKSTIKIE